MMKIFFIVQGYLFLQLAAQFNVDASKANVQIGSHSVSDMSFKQE